VKASKANIGRAVDQPAADVRFYLFHGPDEAQSRALGQRLSEALSASRFIISGSSVKSDPAVLADEAGALNLFGGTRIVWVEPAGDEIAAGLDALLEANAAESPVVAIAGALRKTSAVLKTAEASRQCVAFASYAPEGGDAERMVAEVGRRLGLKISPPVAARVADSAGNDQAIVQRELEKLALYIDASPQAPKELDHDAIDAVGADLPEGETLHLADLAMAGRLGDLAIELGNLPAGSESIPVVRALQRRLLQLAPARARVECGETVDSVMTSLGRSLFWKDKPLVSRMLSLWDSRRLATVGERVGRLENSLLFGAAPDQAALGEELIAIARAAGASRR